MNFRASGEVRDFLRTLAPEPRRAISASLHSIADGSATMEALREPLEKFYKVKSGSFRIICAVQKNTIYALFVERRSVVYEMANVSLLESILESVR